MKTLLDGSSSGADGQGREDIAPVPAWIAAFDRFPAWFLLSMDTALLSFAVVVLWRRQGGDASWLELLLAGGANLLGGLLAMVAVIRPAPVDLEEFPAEEWLVSRVGTSDGERILVFRRLEPAFVGEAKQLPGGRWVVAPLPVEGSVALSPAETARLSVEAADAFQKISEERARAFRASLSV